jgi:sporulation protein YlmC with PRC-barrel domain
MKLIKSLMASAALTALAISGAHAQTSNPTAPTAMPAQSSAISNTQTTDGSRVVTSQRSNQWLASKFSGTDVIGTDDKKIGDVTDVLFDQTGKVDAFVISVGGFLGVGAKDVALAPSAFQVIPNSDGSSYKLKLAMSKDELTQAQNFEPMKDHTTTGSGAMGSSTAPHPATSTVPANTMPKK